MTQEGMVLRREGDRAYVSVIRASACAHDCKGCKSACHEKKQIIVPADNRLGAQIGDFVIIESPTGRVLGQAFILYMIPMIALLGGLVILDLLELSAAAVPAGCGILLVSMLGIGLYDRRLKKKEEIPVVISVVKKDAPA